MCLCGDTACDSCGPAQGFDPAFERAVEALCEKFPALADQEGDLASDLATHIEELLCKERERLAAFLKSRVPGKQGEALAYEIVVGEPFPDPEAEAEEDRLAREYMKSERAARLDEPAETSEFEPLIERIESFDQERRHPVLLNAVRALRSGDLDHAKYLIRNDRDKFDTEEIGFLHRIGLV
jgi:hypothetical protein